MSNDYSGWELVPRNLWGEPWFAEMAVKDWYQVGPLERDEALIDRILAAEAEFWQHVQNGTMPDTIAATLTPVERYRMAAQGREATPPLPRRYMHDLGRLDAIKRQQGALSAERSAIEDRIKSAMGDAEFLVLDGQRRVRWSNVNQTSFDKAGLGRDYPELIEKYTRRGTTRRLDIMKEKA